MAKKMHVRSLSGEVQRIVTSIKIDDRTDKKLSMQGKINAVEDKL
ncbi:MAG: thiamine-binding protein [Clostridiales bacterium]|nr:thiamine-binding protein [Clostridiales bacterium]